MKTSRKYPFLKWLLALLIGLPVLHYVGRAFALPERVSLQAGNFAGEKERWTLRDFGPIVVPKRGMTVALDSVALRHYGRVIDWERRCAESVSEEIPGSTYTFRQDWYFFVGDNFLNSWDSRHFGFVPADFVVGIVPNK